MIKYIKLIEDNSIESNKIYIPSVDEDEYIIPKIKIYDGCNDGSYFFRKIGFNRNIQNED